MKLLSLALAAVALHAPAVASVDTSRFLAVIAQIEGHAPSDLGGRYGISRQVWADNCRASYALSRQTDYAEMVARKHVEWLCREIARMGVSPTPYTIALSWRWGVTGANGRKWVGEYGIRAANLYHSGHRL